MRTIKMLTRSLFFSYLLSALLLTALAFALFRFRLSPSNVGIAVSGIYGISCFFGGFLAGKGLKNRRFLWGMASGILYFLVLTLMSFLIHKGIGESASLLPSVLAICAACGTAGGMLS